VADGILGLRQRLRVLAQAVVKHGGRPFRRGNPKSFAAQRRVLRAAVDQGQRRVLVTAQRRHAEGTVRDGPDARGLGYRPRFGCQRIRRGQITGQQTHATERVEGRRQVTERSLAAGQRDVPAGERVERAVIPQLQRPGTGQWQQAQLRRRAHPAPEAAYGVADNGRSHRKLAAEAGREPGKKGVGQPRSRSSRSSRSSRGGFSRHVCHRRAGSRQAAGGQRGADRVQVSRGGLHAVKPAQPSCGVEEQFRRVAAPVHGEREPGAHEVGARLPVIVQNIGLH